MAAAQLKYCDFTFGDVKVIARPAVVVSIGNRLLKYFDLVDVRPPSSVSTDIDADSLYWHAVVHERNMGQNPKLNENTRRERIKAQLLGMIVEQLRQVQKVGENTKKLYEYF